MGDIEEKLQNFLTKIDQWMYSSNIQYRNAPFDKNDEVLNILDCNINDLRERTTENHQENIMILNQYRHQLLHVVAREKSIKAWAEQGINYLIAGKEFNKFMKWEEKYFTVIKKNAVGEKLQELKTTSEARIMSAEATIKTVETAIKVLENLGRSKVWT